MNCHCHFSSSSFFLSYIFIVISFFFFFFNLFVNKSSFLLVPHSIMPQRFCNRIPQMFNCELWFLTIKLISLYDFCCLQFRITLKLPFSHFPSNLIQLPPPLTSHFYFFCMFYLILFKNIFFFFFFFGQSEFIEY